MLDIYVSMCILAVNYYLCHNTGRHPMACNYKHEVVIVDFNQKGAIC